MKPFDYMSLINKHEHCKVDSNYNSFLTNRFFSFFPDTILYANEANQFQYGLDRQAQFDYYYGALPKRNRFTGKWNKSGSLEDVYLVAEFYSCSLKEAHNNLSLLSANELSDLRKWKEEKDGCREV